MKDIITIEDSKHIFKINCNYGWNFQKNQYAPKNAPKLDEWGNFIEKLKINLKTYKN
jgi:hypothetical protein